MMPIFNNCLSINVVLCRKTYMQYHATALTSRGLNPTNGRLVLHPIGPVMLTTLSTV
jgi:hypothetical protein